jgi:transporter family-2 protein
MYWYDKGKKTSMVRMQAAGYIFLDFITGMVISIMVVCNTELGVASTMGVSLILNHIVGLTILTAIIFFGRKNSAINPVKTKAPWYLWFSGLFGLAILNLNYYTVVYTGASLAMASTVFGQSAISLVYDLTGFMGMKKYSLNKKKVISLAISLAGILVMANSGKGSFSFGFILLGVFAGCLTMTQMVLNSTFSQYKGPFFAARHNFLVGLGAGLLFYFLFSPRETLQGFANLGEISPLLMLSGGTLAVFVVVSTNIVVTKIPAVYSALLLSSAQILMSLAIDATLYSKFSQTLFFGALLMLFGMTGNLLADRKQKAVSPA